MTKRILALVLAALMIGAMALAEITGPLFEADDISDSGTEKSGAFVYRNSDWKEGLVDFEGNVLAEAQFGEEGLLIRKGKKNYMRLLLK